MKKKKRKQRVVVISLLISILTAGSGWAEEDKSMKVRYEFGRGLEIGGDNNRIHFQGLVQGRFTYEVFEALPDEDTFALQRGRVKIEGETFEKKLKFGFQMEFSTKDESRNAEVCANVDCTETVSAVSQESTSGVATLLDAYVDYVPYDFFGVRVGQYKVPFLIQQLTSAGHLQFVDRSLSTSNFDLARDIGMTFHGELWEDGLRYSFFAMNGDGANTLNRNQSLLVGTRFELPVLGKYEASESDVNHSEEVNLGVGVAYVFNELGSVFVNGTIPAGTKTSLATIDMGLKYRGFSTQLAAIVARAHEGAQLTDWGYNSQVGYFFVPKHFEVALRAGGTIFSESIPNQYEYAVALNYFIKGHGFKIQTDYALLQNARDLNLVDHEIRTQLQLVF